MSRPISIRALTLILTSLAACADVSPPDAEPSSREEALVARQVDHGQLGFAAPIPLAIDRNTSLHSFHFVLSAPARIELRTRADVTAKSVDTVLSLFRETASKPLAVNDDEGRSRFSLLTRALPAGSYRVAVQGFKRTTEGSFELVATCQGTGCPAPAAPEGCLFGDTFYELRSEGPLSVLDEHWVRSLEALASDLERQQLVIAVQQSSHTDVTTAAEALAAVDQNEARRMRLRDPASGREYDVFEYGAGDNSYGAIFRADTLFKAASIHDGDLMECTEH